MLRGRRSQGRGLCPENAPEGRAESGVGPVECGPCPAHRQVTALLCAPVSSSGEWGDDSHSARAEGLVRVSCVPPCPARGHFPAGLLPVRSDGFRHGSPLASRGRARHTQALPRSGQFLTEDLSSTLLLSCWLPPPQQERLAPPRGTHSPLHTQAK